MKTALVCNLETLYLRDKTYLKSRLTQRPLTVGWKYLVYWAVRVMRLHILCTRDKQTSALTPPYANRQKQSRPERTVSKGDGWGTCARIQPNEHDPETHYTRA